MNTLSLLKKFTACILVLVVFFGSIQPNFAYAQIITTDLGNTAVNTADKIQGVKDFFLKIKDSVKEFALDTVAFTVAQRISQRLTDKLLAWANGGFEGNPFYYDDPKAHFRGVASEEFEAFVATARSESNPFISTVIRKIEAGRSIYGDGITLDEIFGPGWEGNNLIYDDFSQGGWEGYAALFDPYNNVIGNTLIAENVLNTNVEVAQGRAEFDLLSNDGFISFRACEVTNLNTKYADVQVEVTGLKRNGTYSGLGSAFTARNWTSNAVASFVPAGNQPSQGPIPVTPAPQSIAVICERFTTETPGQALASVTNEAIQEPLARSRIPTEYQQLLANTFTTLISGFTQAGLRKLSQTVNPPLQSFTKPGGPDDLANLDPADWQNAPWVTVDIEKELYGYYLLDDQGNQVQPLELLRPGAVDMTNREFEIVSDMIQNQDHGLQVLPQKILALDQCLPGPDGPGRSWVSRMNEALRNRRAWTWCEKKTGDNDKANECGEAAGEMQQRIAQGVFDVELMMRDPSQQVPSAQEFINMIGQTDSIQSRISDAQGKLVRLAQLQGNLSSIESRANSSNSVDQAQARYQYSLLTNISDESTVASAENELNETIALSNELDNLLTRCNQEVAQAKQDFGLQWTIQYDNNILFCRDLVVDMNDEWDNIINSGIARRGDLGLSCSQFYESSLGDYIDTLYY